MARASLLATLLVGACQRDVGSVEVFLVKSPRAEQDPLDPTHVARIRLRLVASGEEVRTREFDYEPAGTGAIPDVPAGRDWVLTVEGLNASGDVRSRGRSLPFSVGDGARQVVLYVGLVGHASLGHQPLGIPRGAHTATVLTDGKLLLAGGTSALDRDQGPTEPVDAIRSAEVFDLGSAGPVDGAAESCSPQADALCLGAARSFHGAVLQSDGQVLLTGGEDGTDALPSSEIYDPRRRRFFSGPSLSAARAQHVMLDLPSGLVVAGGRSGEFAAMAEAERLRDGSFVRLDPLARARRGANGQVVGDVGLVVGGLDGDGAPVDGPAERFDPGAGRFLSGSAPGVPRAFSSIVALDGDRALLAGGLTSCPTVLDCVLPATGSIEVFDAARREFNEIGTLSVPRWGHTATVLGDGTVLVVGGFGGNEYGAPVPQVEVVDPFSGSSRVAYTLTEPRSFHTTSLGGNGFVYVAGGIGAGGEALSSVEVIVP